MNYQSLSMRLAGGLSLVLMLSACGKNMNIGIPADQLNAAQNQEGNKKGKTGTDTTTGTGTGTGTSTSTGTDTSTGTATGTATGTNTSTSTSTNTDTSVSGSVAVDAKLAELNVVQPLTVADLKSLQEKNISLDRADRAELERKTARVLFKSLPESVMLANGSTEVITKKGKKTKKVKSSNQGNMSIQLVIDREKSGLDVYSNLKLCLFVDLRGDICVSDADIVKKSAYIQSNDPNLVKVDVVKAFGINADYVFKNTSSILIKNDKGELDQSEYFRKLLLSYEGMKTLEGATLEVVTEAIKGKVVPTGYTEAKLVGMSDEDLTPSTIK
jgi:hypothetical protein